MTEPWYQDGLRFECTRCGKCCTGAPGFVWVNEDEIAAIAERLGESVAAVTARYTRPESGQRRSLKEKPNWDCIFWDRAVGCTIYEDRPRQCRTWPFWRSRAGTPEAWEETRQACPGAGQGPLISAEEITRRIRVIDL